MPVVVLIAGASGSGKSHIAEQLRELLLENGLKAVKLALDDYYKPRPAEIKTERQIKEYSKTTNFDHPDAIDFALFHQQLEALSRGETINKPMYDFCVSDRQEQTESIEAEQVIIAEGILALHDFHKLNIANIVPIFISANSYLSYQSQRKERDLRERGKTKAQFIRQEIDTVRPGFFEFIIPTKRYAKYVIHNTLATMPETTDACLKPVSLDEQLSPVVEAINSKLPQIASKQM